MRAALRINRIKMFDFFKKKKITAEQQTSFEIELTAAVLAYEIARSDGEVSKDELSVLMEEIESNLKSSLYLGF